MSAKRNYQALALKHAPVFAAMGDETRLRLVSQLSEGDAKSISELADGSSISRQAITKHLRVLEDAGIVRSVRNGRENLFAFEPKPLVDLEKYLQTVSVQWDSALGRLKSFVEKD